MNRHEPMPVHRVEHETGSHIEPPLEQYWSDLDKLRWHAGALEARTGIRVEITTGCSTRNDIVQWHLFGYTIRDTHGGFVSSGGPMDFHQMWAWLNGIKQGCRVAAREDADA